METINKREAWNKGKLVGQKPPLKPKDIWAILRSKKNNERGELWAPIEFDIGICLEASSPAYGD